MSRIIKNFLEENYSTNPIKYRINIFDSVRDFLYQINWISDINKLLKVREWYCVSKCRVLKKCYEELWYEAKLCFTPFKFNQIYLPDSLLDWWLSDKQWYHVFLRLKINNQFIDIDPSFNKELKDYYTVNQYWDWISSQNVIFEYKEVYIPSNIEEESEIKNKLADDRWFDEDDFLWIKKYNLWLRSMIS